MARPIDVTALKAKIKEAEKELKALNKEEAALRKQADAVFRRVSSKTALLSKLQAKLA